MSRNLLPEPVESGISDFNRGRFYECHDSLEDAWREEKGRVRFLYQGILQIGVGLYHQRNGNWRGATALISKGVGRLEEFSPETFGIDIARLRRESAVCLEELHHLGRMRVGDFDRELIPQIRHIDGHVIITDEPAEDTNPSG